MAPPVSRTASKPAEAPLEELVLDFDATDDAVHGHQEGRFFHGYYDDYCFLPLYVFPPVAGTDLKVGVSAFAAPGAPDERREVAAAVTGARDAGDLANWAAGR